MTTLPAVTSLPSISTRQLFDARVAENYDRLLALAQYFFSRGLHAGTALDADDIVIMTFERIWKYTSQPDKYPAMQYDPARSSYYTFCRLQLLHVYYDLNRRRAKHFQTISLDGLNDPDVASGHSKSGEFVPEALRTKDVYHEVADKDARDSFFRDLDAMEREFIALRLEGRGVPEIAENLSMKPSTLYNTIWDLQEAFARMN